MSTTENEFQFELNEALYFEDGYHVQELISISLEPEISIQPSDNYVSIRGEVELRGEYNQAIEDNTADESTLDFADFHAKRFVEKVTSLEENQMEFSHRFPVDISIPSYRIQEIDDIRVEILSFDYELPTNNQLDVSAIAVIYGIKEDVDLLKEKREKQVESNLDEPELSAFAFEIKKQETEEENTIVEEAVVEENSLSMRQEEEQVEDKVVASSEPIIELRKSEKIISPEPTIELRKNERDTEQIEEVEIVEEEYDISNEDVREENQVNDEIPRDVSYLTDMFHGEAEENYSKMRICIVQDDDTIETIADRFQVSTLQLIKQNKLEEDFDVSEGQLLYIPIK